jgi:hypothetical protein
MTRTPTTATTTTTIARIIQILALCPVDCFFICNFLRQKILFHGLFKPKNIVSKINSHILYIFGRFISVLS